MIIIYDVIYRWKEALGYSLLIKIKLWTKTKQLIINLTQNNLIATVKKIKETNRCINSIILAFKW